MPPFVNNVQSAHDLSRRPYSPPSEPEKTVADPCNIARSDSTISWFRRRATRASPAPNVRSHAPRYSRTPLPHHDFCDLGAQVWGMDGRLPVQCQARQHECALVLQPRPVARARLSPWLQKPLHCYSHSCLANQNTVTIGKGSVVLTDCHCRKGFAGPDGVRATPIIPTSIARLDGMCEFVACRDLTPTFLFAKLRACSAVKLLRCLGAMSCARGRTCIPARASPFNVLMCSCESRVSCQSKALPNPRP